MSMDIYSFIINLVAVVGSLFLAGGFLYYFGIRPQTKKLMEESRKLQLKMNQLRSSMTPGEEDNGLIGEAIGSLGIEGLLAELGVPKAFQGIAKGFIDSIMADPKKLKALAEKFGVKVPNEPTTEESGVLL